MNYYMIEIIDDYIRRFPHDGYLRYHAPRYATLLRLIKNDYKNGERVLDIGRGRLTEIISDSLKAPVDTLGFQPDSDTTSGRHYHYDLNNCQTLQSWRRDIGHYDVIIFAEVIEHLYTSPNLVLSFINSITSEGGRVFLQTPNAVALHKRLTMLIGKNPYETIREDNFNPGHFREYTKKELLKYSNNTGFQVKKSMYGNYFDYRFLSHASNPMSYKPQLKIFNYLYSLCPRSFKPGITLVLVKERESNSAHQQTNESGG